MWLAWDGVSPRLGWGSLYSSKRHSTLVSSPLLMLQTWVRIQALPFCKKWPIWVWILNHSLTHTLFTLYQMLFAVYQNFWLILLMKYKKLNCAQLHAFYNWKNYLRPLFDNVVLHFWKNSHFIQHLLMNKYYTTFPSKRGLTQASPTRLGVSKSQMYYFISYFLSFFLSFFLFQQRFISIPQNLNDANFLFRLNDKNFNKSIRPNKSLIFSLLNFWNSRHASSSMVRWQYARP